VIALVTESSAAGPFQDVQRRLGGGWDRGQRLVPGVEGLAGGEGRGGPAGSQRGTVPAGDLLGQQDRERLGRVPALRLGGGQDLRGAARRMYGSRIRRSSWPGSSLTQHSPWLSPLIRLAWPRLGHHE
jgi:hypothetical protein